MIKINRKAYIIGSAVSIAVLLLAWAWFHVHGGTPWARARATREANQILLKAFPKHNYTLHGEAFYDWMSEFPHTYGVTVSFPQYPLDWFGYQLANGQLHPASLGIAPGVSVAKWLDSKESSVLIPPV